MSWLIIIAVVIFIYWILNGIVDHHDHWQHAFNFKFSSQRFYELVEEAVESRKMPDVEFSRVFNRETGITSPEREYLRIEQKEFVFDICAAPYGTGFFVSSWCVVRQGFWRQILLRIPIINIAIRRKTYYQYDTEGMFKSAVHDCIMEAIDAMTKTSGSRTLSEYERRFVEQATSVIL
jgi:hypothetical protein